MRRKEAIRHLTDLEQRFDAEYVHADDLLCWWNRILQCMWDAALETIPKECIKPFLNDFHRRFKELPAIQSAHQR
jgi:hypothetical protein